MRGWYWRYTRHRHVMRSKVRFDEPPSPWAQFVCRVLLGWKLERL